MCGIVGYVGSRSATDVLLSGLRRLEYRGYDSAGVALVQPDGLMVHKRVGRVSALSPVPEVEAIAGGIAHTRWATHGGVTQPNAHPHTDGPRRIAVVHNGILDNAPLLRTRLREEGVVFRSETDTEVLPHLIRKFYDEGNEPVEAVRLALKQVRGTYGVAVAFADHPQMIIAARKGSPLVIGVGDGETFLASDPHAISPFTRRVVYLDDGDLASIVPGDYRIHLLNGGSRSHAEEELEEVYGEEGLGDFPHYMLKEIHEQPESIRRCLGGRVDESAGNARLGGFEMSPADLMALKRVTILGCGTSYHAGMVGAQILESVARLPANVEIASEFRNRNPVIDPETLFLAVSQSGETFDTLEAIKEVQIKGANVYGVVNVVGSTIARTCGAGVYVHSGPEIAVASTKAFTSQLSALYLFSLMVARARNLPHYVGRDLARALTEIPEKVESFLESYGRVGQGPIQQAADHLRGARYALFMGRGLSYPVALEGALKLKEIAYIPCEAYPAGEMKHGPIAMMERGTPVIAIVPDDEHRTHTLSNMEEVKARGASIIAVHTQGDLSVTRLADVSIPVPRTERQLTPLLTALPLQLLSYQVALALGRDIDRPRNLAKSVTVG